MKLKLIRAIPLLFCGLVACGSRIEEKVNSVNLYLSDGDYYSTPLINTLIYLQIRPNSESAAQIASSARLIIDGRVVNALINTTGVTNYNITADLIPCKSVKPGKNIKIEYNYLSQSGSILESGQVTLAEVIATCN